MKTELAEKASIALIIAVAVFLVWLCPAFFAGLFAGAVLYAIGEKALEKEEDGIEATGELPDETSEKNS